MGSSSGNNEDGIQQCAACLDMSGHVHVCLGYLGYSFLLHRSWVSQ